MEATFIKWILFLTFIGIFIATAIITLRGITNKINVKPGYLKALFTALIIELIGAVTVSYSEFVNPQQHSIHVENGTQSVQLENPEQFIEIDKYNQDINLRDNKVTTCSNNLTDKENELQKLQKQLDSCIIPKSGILSELLEIQEDIRKFAPSINFSFKPHEKKDAAFRTMNVLGALGHIDGEPTDDPEIAAKALKSYQLKKGINPASGRLGRKTFIQFLNDYAIAESQGG